MCENVLTVQNLDLRFGDNGFHLEISQSLSIRNGEILGILGESGCGKSTFGKCLIGLINKRDKLQFNVTDLGDSRIEFSLLSTLFRSGNVLTGSRKELREYRGYVQMMFQNPRSALNLNMPVEKILEESVRLANPHIERSEVHKIAEKLAAKFGLGGDEWKGLARSKARVLSGGQRRRLSAAKVFALNPSIIIADEPVAGLDVSIRGKLLETLKEEWEVRKEQWENGKANHPLTLVIISHDFDMIRRLCHRTIVFYGDIHVRRGTVVEILQGKEASSSIHPYTEHLQEAAQYMNSPNARMGGRLRSAIMRRDIYKNGCVYINKCEYVMDRCFEAQPKFVGNSNHRKACFLPE